MGLQLVGVALSTFIVYCISERSFLVGYLWLKMNIKPSEYIPVRVYGIYSFLIGLVFILIDHRIIDILRVRSGQNASCFGLRTSDFRLPSSDFRLRTSDFGLRTSVFGLPPSAFRLQYFKNLFIFASAGKYPVLIIKFSIRY